MSDHDFAYYHAECDATILYFRTELQRYKDALEACKEVITRLGGCVCDDCIERELAAIQATKDKKGN